MEKDFRVIGPKGLVRAFIAELKEMGFSYKSNIEDLPELSERGKCLSFAYGGLAKKETALVLDTMDNSVAGGWHPLLQLPVDWERAKQVAQNRLDAFENNLEIGKLTFSKIKGMPDMIRIKHSDRLGVSDKGRSSLASWIRNTFEISFFGQDKPSAITFGCTTITKEQAEQILTFLKN